MMYSITRSPLQCYRRDRQPHVRCVSERCRRTSHPSQFRETVALPEQQRLRLILNPWYYREAFSRLPFIHWFPKTITNKILRMLNKRTIEDIFYQSPKKMAQLLKTAGFINIDYFPAGLGHEELDIFKKVFGKLTSYYAMTADKK